MQATCEGLVNRKVGKVGEVGGWHGEPDGEGEAWEVDWWGMASGTCSSYIVEVLLE